MRQAGAARHRRSDRDDLLVCVGKFRERLADDLRIGRRRRRRGLAALDLVFAEAVEFVRLLDRRLVAFAFLGQNVEQHRLVLRLQKFERPDEQRNVVAIDRSVITQTELLEDHARHEQAFHALLDFVRELHAGFPKDRLDEIARLLVQMRVGRVGDDAVKVIRNRADIFRDRPFIVVQHDDEPLGLRSDVVQRFVTDPAGERGVARDHDDVLVAAAQIAPDRHAERGGERRAGVTRAVAVVLALGAQKEIR